MMLVKALARFPMKLVSQKPLLLTPSIVPPNEAILILFFTPIYVRQMYEQIADYAKILEEIQALEEFL